MIPFKKRLQEGVGRSTIGNITYDSSQSLLQSYQQGGKTFIDIDRLAPFFWFI